MKTMRKRLQLFASGSRMRRETRPNNYSEADRRGSEVTRQCKRGCRVKSLVLSLAVLDTADRDKPSRRDGEVQQGCGALGFCRARKAMASRALRYRGAGNQTLCEYRYRPQFGSAKDQCARVGRAWPTEKAPAR